MMNGNELYKFLTENLTNKAATVSNIEDEADSAAIDYPQRIFDFIHKHGMVVNEEHKGLFPSSMFIRCAQWKDGYHDPHLEDNIYIDYPKEVKDHHWHSRDGILSLDYPNMLSFEIEGKKRYVTLLAFDFGKLWVEFFTLKRIDRGAASRVELGSLDTNQVREIYSYLLSHCVHNE